MAELGASYSPIGVTPFKKEAAVRQALPIKFARVLHVY